MHEPRFKWGLGIGYAVSPTGADHCHNIHDSAYETDSQPERTQPFGILEPIPSGDLSAAKVRITFYHIHFEVMKNMIGLCLFVPYTPKVLVEAISAITGWETSIFDLFKAGERGMALARAFNAREGMGPETDVLPKRYFEAFESGPLAGKAPTPEEFTTALDGFYELSGWDSKTGVPTPTKYAELDLAWVTDPA